MKGGVDEIKKHKFFKDIDFEQIGKRNYSQVPYVPLVGHAGDASNFDQCDDEEKITKHPAAETYGDAFKDF